MAELTRREALTAAGAALAGATLVPAASAGPEGGKIVQKGRIKQSVCRWCYEKIPMPEFVKAVAGMGLTAIDLVEEKDWSAPRRPRPQLLDGLEDEPGRHPRRPQRSRRTTTRS